MLRGCAVANQQIDCSGLESAAFNKMPPLAPVERAACSTHARVWFGRLDFVNTLELAL